MVGFKQNSNCFLVFMLIVWAYAFLFGLSKQGYFSKKIYSGKPILFHSCGGAFGQDFVNCFIS